MRGNRRIVWAALGFPVLMLWLSMQMLGEEPNSVMAASSSVAGSVSISGVAASSFGFERGISAEPPDPCRSGEVVASPSRPYWDAGAATTPCGNVETDVGFVLQPMGGGVRQRLLVSSVRYGLTPRMDLRFGGTNKITQSGGGLEPMEGVGDASFSVTYRFHEQGRRTPAMALSYGLKLPTANPDKDFGSGLNDHQFLLIASRDFGATHLDFNIVGSWIGEPDSHDGAAQFGLAVTRPVTRKLSLIAESYGGPQPETEDRFGAVLAGGSYALRPWLVLDGAVTRTYTDGSPRQQVLFGITYARRPGIVLVPRGSRIGRLLGQ